MSADEAAPWQGLTYGATERLLADLHETSPESIRSRFRKLRLRPFPDEIRSGTGRRVAYDLPRILALAAVFDLNRLYIPQGHAVDMVETCWPEWCRAYISAASAHSLLPEGLNVPKGTPTAVRLFADAFRDPDRGPELLSPFPSAHGDDNHEVPPMIEVDAGRTVALLCKAVPTKAPLMAAFAKLERAFGWTPLDFPHRASVAEMSRGRGFLDDGPYFERAAVLLNGGTGRTSLALTPLANARTQALIDYLEDPAPIDRWKAEIGEDEDRPRLGHLLSFWAASTGLMVRKGYPEITQSLTGRDVREVALEYIASASKGIGSPPCGKGARSVRA